MNFWLEIATLGPVGYIPCLPGTVASVFGLLLGWCLNNFLSLPVGFLLIILFLLGASEIANRAEKFFGRKDDQRIVIDELVGMLFAGYGIRDWRVLLLAFLFFRLFDMTKILGIRQTQKLPGGYGIVTDDVIAGVYSRLVILALYYGKSVFLA